MWASLFSRALKARVALWAIDMALPDGGELARRYRAGLLGLMAAVAGGVLLAVTAIGALIGLGVLLHDYAHYSIGASMGIVALLTLAVTVTLFAVGRAQLSAAFDPCDERHRNSELHEDPFRELIHGFVEGFATPASGQPEPEDEESPYLREAV